MIRNAATAERLAEVGDAFVEVDRTNDRWMIGTDDLVCSVRRGRDGTLAFEGLFIGRSDDALGYGEGAEALVTIGGATHRLGETGSPFTVESIDATTGSDSVALGVTFTSRDYPVTVTRYYLAWRGAAAIEVWTEIDAQGDEDVTVSDLNAFALTVPTGSLEWLTGLESPDGLPSFTRRMRSPHDGERIELGSPVLSSLHNVPFFSIGNGHRRFFAALAWSGQWSASLTRVGEQIALNAGLGGMSAVASRGRSVEGPHAVVGVVLDQEGAVTHALTRYVYACRAGRDFPALTTFNTWFLHGTGIDERVIRDDMDAASPLGIELFQIDAGWYPGARREEPFDFTSGLGSWTLDAERFPSGFAALRGHADRRGLRLAIWMEPERVALSVVGQGGLQERFLAQQDGRYDPSHANEAARDAQLCLADAEAGAWVFDRITQLIDQVGADYIKWDMNRWVSCTRSGHGHPSDGGNFAHTRALYDILERLRARYPSLLIENCAGGARRADLAMARLTDVLWMDDRTAPSAHVRYNLDGLLAVFPAPYLLSYVMSHPAESINGHEDIPMLVRSRMPGVVGLTTDLHRLAERERNELHQQFELARRLRSAYGRTTTYTLTPQTTNDTEWRVVQQVSHATGTSAIFAYAYGMDTRIRVMPRQIRADVDYELRSADRGRMGTLHGADLIAGGLDIHAAPETALQVLILEPLAAAARVQ